MRVGDLNFRFSVSGTSSVESAAQSLSSTMQDVGESVSRVGRRLSLLVSGPLAAAGAASAKAAGDFEESFSRIEGLVGVAEDQVNNFKSEVLALSGEVAQSPRDLADAMFQITSAGLEGEQAINALEASAKAAAAGLGDTKTVADAATSAMNAFGKNTLSAAEATDVLTAAVREGKVEPDELAGSLGKVIPTAASLGVEFEQVGAALAAMTRQGANARRSTTALNSLLSQIQKPSKEAEEALSGVGLSVDDLRAAVEEDGLLAVMDLLEDKFQGNTDALGALFGNVRAMRAALQLTGENADTTRQIFNELSNSTGATEEAFSEAKETFNFQFDQLRSSLNRLRIEIGGQLLPTLTSLTERATSLIDSFSGLSDSTQTVVVAVGAAAAAIGPLLVGLGSMISLAGTAIGALAGLSAPLVGAAGLVAALGVAAASSEQFRNDLLSAFRSAADSARSIWDSYGDEFVTLTRDAFQVAVDVARTVLQALVDTVATTAAILAGDWEGAFSRMKQAQQNWLSNLEDTAQSTINTLESLGELIGQIRSAWQSLQSLKASLTLTIGGVEVGPGMEAPLFQIADFFASDEEESFEIQQPKFQDPEPIQFGADGDFDLLGTINEFVQQARQSLEKTSTKARETGREIGDSISGGFSSALEGIKTFDDRLGEFRQSPEAKDVTEGGFAKPAGGASIGQMVDDAQIQRLNVTTQQVERLRQKVGQARNETSLFQQAGQRLSTTLRQGFLQVGDAIGQGVTQALFEAKSAAEALSGAFKQAIQKIIRQVIALIAKLVIAKTLKAALGGAGGAGSAVQGLISGGGGGIPAAQTGGFVQESGLAQIHKGESILPEGASVNVSLPSSASLGSMPGSSSQGQRGAGPQTARRQSGGILIPDSQISQAKDQGDRDRDRTGRTSR